MKIAYLGCGIWAFALAKVLAKKATVHFWCREEDIYQSLKQNNEHPRAPGIKSDPNIIPFNDIEKALEDVDLIVEGSTSAGVRPVFEKIKERLPKVPIVITSKGIEQHTGLLMSEVILEILGDEFKPLIGCLSGPSVAPEVLRENPTAVVASGFDGSVIGIIVDLFTCEYMSVYTNDDIHGVEFGGAMKNIIAIACGISDGLGFGTNTKAAIMTRGLHEISQLAKLKGCKPQTLYGLSGMGDLCLTCMSTLSRNYQLGELLATGKSLEEAKSVIGMVTEGAYTAVSAIELKKSMELPIIEAVYEILYEKKDPKEMIRSLLGGSVKQEIYE